VIHRDIKPANLLLDRQGTVKILDIGLARMEETLAGEAPSLERRTSNGQVMGTCDCMAPEQAEGTATPMRVRVSTRSVAPCTTC